MCWAEENMAALFKLIYDFKQGQHNCEWNKTKQFQLIICILFQPSFRIDGWCLLCPLIMCMVHCCKWAFHDMHMLCTWALWVICRNIWVHDTRCLVAVTSLFNTQLCCIKQIKMEVMCLVCISLYDYANVWNRFIIVLGQTLYYCKFYIVNAYLCFCWHCTRHFLLPFLRNTRTSTHPSGNSRWTNI